MIVVAVVVVAVVSSDGGRVNSLVPNSQKTVPGASANCHPVLRNAQTTHTVIVARENTSPILFERVPDIAVEVVVAAEQEAPTLAEGDTGDAADDVVVRKHTHFLVGANVEEAAGRVITARAEGKAAGEEGDCIDI